MSQSGAASLNHTLGSVTITSTVTRTAARVEGHDVTLPAGIAGAITPSAAGIDGLATGHGIEAADVVDVHWDDPSDSTHKVRRGLTVDTAGTNDITYDETPAGEGDALPVEDTACVVAVQVEVVLPSIDGDLIQMIASVSGIKSMVDIRTSSATKQVIKHAVGVGWSWIADIGDANPFASATMTLIRATNGTVAVGSFNLAILYDLT